MSNDENTDDITAQEVKKAIMDTGRVTAIINEVLDKREPALEQRIMARVADLIPGYVRDGVYAGMAEIRKELQVLGNKIETGHSAQSSRISNVETRQNTSDQKVNNMESELQITKEGMLKQGHTIEKTRDDVSDIIISLNGDPNKTNDRGIRGSVDSLVDVMNQLNQRMISAELWQNNADRYVEVFWRTVKSSARRAWEFRRLITFAGVGGGTAGAFLLKALEALIGG